MEKKKFSVAIDAPKEKVWNILWDHATYPLWTAPFCEGSKAETNWEKGTKVRFLGPDNEGMVSTIAEKMPNEFMSFKHLGIVKNGIEDYDSQQAKQWDGALENYTLSGANGNTELVVDIDIADPYLEYFETTWPMALQKVKELSEKN